MERMNQSLRNRLEIIQRILNFDNWSEYPQFSTQNGLGRTAMIGCILGIIFGIHLVLWIQLTYYVLLYQFGTIQTTTTTTTTTTVLLLLVLPVVLLASWEWCTYICTLCIFHVLEFFITAIYNPSVASASSFLINHSTSYTTAALSSWIEFIVRQFLFCCFVVIFPQKKTIPKDQDNDTNTSTGSIVIDTIQNFYWYMSFFGLLVVIVGQWIRSCAMITASESFNHYIQTSKNCNHTLITNGIYSYVRHPSYTGFFFWSIGTQLVLGNILHTIVYTITLWNFFYKRIAYEEESLCLLFPNEYPQYISTTWSGIPFVYTLVPYNNKTTESTTSASINTTITTTTNTTNIITTKQSEETPNNDNNCRNKIE